MGLKVILSYDAHGNSHPPLSEGNHWDYHFSLLPFLMTLSLLTVANKHSWWDPIQSSKALYTFLKVYQIGEPTHS